MEIEKHNMGRPPSEHMWTIHGAELNPNIKLLIKGTEELIELYNLIIHELEEEGIIRIRSN